MDPFSIGSIETMDNKMKMLVSAIIICIFLIALKMTVFPSIFDTDELIPGVTDSEIFTEIPGNSSLGEYILSDDFMDDISKVHIESKSELYGTNETEADRLFKKCCDHLIGAGLEEDHVKTYPKEGRYSGVYKNETRRIIFHIFEGEDIEEKTGFYLILTVYKGRAI